MEFDSISELLKMFREAFGARVTQIALWLALCIGVITAIPHVMRMVEEVVILSKSENVNWESVAAIWLAVGLVLFSAAVVGILLGFLVRVSGWVLFRKQMNEIKSDIAAIKKRLDEMDAEKR